jgi:hypothetical protein
MPASFAFWPSLVDKALACALVIAKLYPAMSVSDPISANAAVPAKSVEAAHRGTRTCLSQIMIASVIFKIIALLGLDPHNQI